MFRWRCEKSPWILSPPQILEDLFRKSLQTCPLPALNFSPSSSTEIKRGKLSLLHLCFPCPIRVGTIQGKHGLQSVIKQCPREKKKKKSGLDTGLGLRCSGISNIQQVPNETHKKWVDLRPGSHCSTWNRVGGGHEPQPPHLGFK